MGARARVGALRRLRAVQVLALQAHARDVGTNASDWVAVNWSPCEPRGRAGRAG